MEDIAHNGRRSLISDGLDGTDHTPSTVTAARAPVVLTTPMKPTRIKTNPPFDAEPSEIENRADHTECVAIGKHLAQECPKLIIYERDENENERTTKSNLPREGEELGNLERKTESKKEKVGRGEGGEENAGWVLTHLEILRWWKMPRRNVKNPKISKNCKGSKENSGLILMNLKK